MHIVPLPWVTQPAPSSPNNPPINDIPKFILAGVKKGDAAFLFVWRIMNNVRFSVYFLNDIAATVEISRPPVVTALS